MSISRLLDRRARFASILVLSAAAAYGPAQAQPRKGGEVVIATRTYPGCVDARQLGGIVRELVGYTTDRLTDIDPRTGKTIPYLAKSWTVNADATRFVLSLRRGVTFSDGTPFDASSVKQNIQTLFDAKGATPNARQSLAGLKAIDVVDADTVAITFAKPKPDFLRAAAHNDLAMFAPAWFKLSDSARCSTVIATGPYTVKTLNRDTGWTLVRRPDYSWPSVWTGTAPGPFLDSIQFRLVPEAGIRLNGLVSGQFQVITHLDPDFEKMLTAQGARVVGSESIGAVWSLAANINRPPLDEKDVRLAALHAIDLNGLKQGALFGSWQQVAKGVLSEKTPGFINLADRLKHDPAQARALLDKAGWTEQAGGIRGRNGQKLTVEILYAREDQVVLLVQQQLRAVGFDAKVRKVDQAERMALTSAGNYSFYFHARANTLERSAIAQAYSTRYANYLGGGKPGLNADKLADLDKLTDELLMAPTDKGSYLISAKIQKLLLDEAYVIPLNPYAEGYAVTGKLRGWQFTGPGLVALSLRDAWLEK